MKSTIIAMTVILSALNVFAQNSMMIQPNKKYRIHPDSIRLEFPDQHGLMIFQFRNFLKLSTDQFKNDLTTITQVVTRIEKSLPSTSKPMKADVIVNEAGEQKITIREPENPVTRISATDKEITELLPPGWELVIHNSARAEIYIYAQTFDELKSIIAFNSDAVKQLIVDESHKIFVGRKRIISRMIIQKGEIAFNSTKFQMPLDQLEFSPLCGFGYVSRTFVPSLGIMASFSFGSRRNLIENQYCIIYDNMFFTNRTADGKFTNRSNSFLSVAYSLRFGDKKDFTWATFGAGYLIYKTGDYFQGKTAKFFFSTSVGKFALTPELYLTNDFRNFQTGLKLSYRF
jgi:hypothetical protein